LAARDGDKLAAAAAQLSSQAQTAQADVNDLASLQALFTGLERLDHVFVTAGAIAGGPVATTEIAALRATLDSRIWGAYTIARLAAPRLRAGGSLTFTTSTSATRPPRAGLSIGSAAVAGVEGLVRALALELAPLRVNVVRPSATDTPLLRSLMGGADDAAVAAAYAELPLGRAARPDEVAAAALFCMSNPYVTGSVVVVDGGTSLA
ncbi:MAG: SDR family oxidoreductase, partial [Roseiflexaceae bacterium]|nr:SDR family oxidoreductase [Roseiflexaceae bacterium]